MNRPRFGFLLDVDGPIASPVHRRITELTIVPDLLSLLAAGCPVVFNTGRSEDFLRREVIEPMLDAGLPDAAHLYGVCEKGAVWFSVEGGGIGSLQVDHQLAVPEEYGKAIERLVQDRFTDSMFFDHTKLAMVSVEQSLNIASDEYRLRQVAFDDSAIELFRAMDLGVRRLDQTVPDSRGNVDFRIDPTIISTDIESILLGKDRGAMRALELLQRDDQVPSQWRTVGDSRSDYAMADWLHTHGHEVAHVDVRPAEGVPPTNYPVVRAQRHDNDRAGAAYLRRICAIVDGQPEDEPSFDA